MVYKGPLYKLLLNLIGLDGYLCYSYNIKVFNLVGIGEWFLGAIIIIYFLYPLLVLIFNKNIFILNYVIFINYYLMYKTKVYSIVINEHNIFTCLKSFYFGMIAIKYKFLFFQNKVVFIISFLMVIVLFIFKISKTFFLISQIHGFALYIVLMQLGEYITSHNYQKIFVIFSKLSYSIFLYHHCIIRDILQIYNPSKLHLHLIMLSISIAIIIMYATIHYNIVNWFIKSKIIKKLDSYLLK